VEIVALISHPAFWVAVAAIEEIIALSPLKANSIVQLVLRALRAVRPTGKK
jgi:hypothetical protein